MKLRLALLTIDLGFRFHVSATTVNSIFITWIKLMSKELTSVLIVWPSWQQVKKTLPSCFRKLYPKFRCIIDCFECFTETPSGLDLAATLWSEYKHHYTFKVFVAITPNGAISYVFIVRNSGFLNMIEPYDEIMADRGFKIRYTWWCTWQHYASHQVVHHLGNCITTWRQRNIKHSKCQDLCGASHWKTKSLSSS